MRELLVTAVRVIPNGRILWFISSQFSQARYNFTGLLPIANLAQCNKLHQGIAHHSRLDGSGNDGQSGGIGRELVK